MFETLILMLDATIRTAPPLILAAMNDRHVLRVEGSPHHV
ncbi:hypothetical protein M2366_002999 [Aeromonas sp. BIGb0405]|jgi:hypothetical protein|nr:hypothetical protein [Aeromonas sp. BIGb0405]MCS3460870.1 hypothetical protein [Aeromonas sp. BIGb0445]